MKEVINDSNLQDLFKSAIEKVKVLMETNTIVGDPIQINDSTAVIPISKVSVGFVLGGGEYSDKSSRRVANRYPMAAGSGCGMSVNPVGFIVINKSDVKFVDIENKTMYQTILNLVNKIISSINPEEESKNEKNKK